MKYSACALLSIMLQLQKERGNGKWKKKKKKGKFAELDEGSFLGTPDSLVCGSWTPLSEPFTRF